MPSRTVLERTPVTGRPASSRALFVPAAALLAAAIALAELALRWQERHAVDPAGVVMVPVTALGVLLAAGSLLLVGSSLGPRARRVGQLGALGTAVLGLLILVQYGVDVLAAAAAAARLETSPLWWARRPSPTTGVGLLFLGAALVPLGMRRARGLAHAGAYATLLVALTVVVGHAYGAGALYGFNPWGGTAVSTAVALTSVAFGVVFADPSRGIAAVVLSDSPGGRLLRRLLPAAVLAPLLIGWLAVVAHRAQLVDVAFGTALLVVTVVALLVGYVVRQAHAVHAEHAARERLLSRERETSDRVTNILESITDAFFAVDRRWRFTYVNREAERLLHRSREGLLGKELWAEFPAAVGATFQRAYEQAMAEQKTVQFEERYAPLDAWFHVRAYPAPDGLSVYFHDVTARKRAEETLRESEERHRLLTDMIPQHIWTTDADGYHNYFSRRWYEYTGTAAEQSQGAGWLAWLHPDDRERTMERWQHSLRTGEPYAIEYRFRSAHGDYHWFLGQAMPLRNAAGEIVRWFGTLTDITERKQAEEAVRESEARFRALADSLPQLAWMADPSGWIHWYNERWHAFTGTAPEEVQGWGWRKVHHPEHVDRVVRKIRHAFETGEPWEDTFPLRSRSGEYRWFLSRALPIRDGAGKVVRWLGTNTDITEQMQAAAERERLLAKEQEARSEADRRRAEVERITESRARLIRGFSHDVRNPLGVADAQAYLLEDGRRLGPLNDKQRESVERIRRSIRISLGLIDDLLELARAEAGQIELVNVETDVARLACEVAEDFQAQAGERGVALEARAAESLKTGTDPARVRQVLGNLVSNALKYAPHRPVRVDAAARQGGPAPGEWIAVSVIDHGPGIPQDQREKIFQEFTRLDPGAQQGAGIGLAISRRVARLLDGDLTVDSESGRGCTFTLWLPVRASGGSRKARPPA